MIDPIESQLKKLAEPRLPDAFAASVMARVARLPEPGAGRRSTPASATPQPRDRFAWAAMGAGAAVAVVSWMIGTNAIVSVSSLNPFLHPATAGDVALSAPSGTLLAAGLLLYMAGLFAPFVRQSRI
jgi:hypothetical protein